MNSSSILRLFFLLFLNFADAFQEICSSPPICVCDHLIKIANPHLERTLVVDLDSKNGNNLVNPNQTSFGTWLSFALED